MGLSEAMAERALFGRGDATLGEWREAGRSGVFHIRRRLTAEEEQLGQCAALRDVRDTPEAKARMAVLFHDAPYLRRVFENQEPR